MGIPHLITFLQPYSELRSLAGQKVAIDGPGFAYHIYYVSLTKRSALRNPFEAAPSYAELAQLAISWLDGLRSSQVIMCVIGLRYVNMMPSIIKLTGPK